nr:MAG TPA: hypothetical protein [Caudoviricetes sp.]
MLFIKPKHSWCPLIFLPAGFIYRILHSCNLTGVFPWCVRVFSLCLRHIKFIKA